jgi:hypothetical protein
MAQGKPIGIDFFHAQRDQVIDVSFDLLNVPNQEQDLEPSALARI